MAFVQRVLIVLTILALAYFFWTVRHAVLLGFAGVVVATVLVAAAEPIHRATKLPHGWSLLVAGTLILVLIAGMFLLIGTDVARQVSTLLNQLPEAVQNLEGQLGVSFPGPETLQRELEQRSTTREDGTDPGLALSGRLLAWIASWSTMVFGAITSFILVVVAGVYLAIDPATYRSGFARLFSEGQRHRVDETLVVCGESLRLWLIAQLISMSIVGVLVGLGTWWIGLPGPVALGLFAGLTEFIPIIGPILGAVPALVFAATEGLAAFLWTAALFLAVQQLEANIITPYVQRRMITIPPALLLISLVAFSLLFGTLGLILAAPLTVVAFVAVKKLYVRETLGQATKVPGENTSQSSSQNR
jgi:predicted PurR-regulated permease PerM